jgi:hypothetical protein
MRLRFGLLLTCVLATLLSPITPPAIAFGGYASAPLSVTATAIAGGVQVGWSTPTDVDTGITGYRVEYSTSGTSGTWTLAATVSSGTASYDIVGLSQVATYVRVAATTAAGIGTYGYPWTKIYGTTTLNRDINGYVTYQSGFGLGGADPYTTKSGAAFTRIRYRMDATISGTAYYADADAYEWPNGTNTDSRGGFDPSITSLMIPSQNSPYQYQIQANVADLNVYSNNGNVTKGSGLSGRLEIWPWNYGVSANGLSPAGSGANYDYDDTWQTGGYYGSFQIHDMTNLKPVFVWNNSSYGANPEVAFGKNTGTHPDWTFCSQAGGMGSCPLPSAFALQIFVNIPVTPLADATPPTISRIDSRTLGKNGDTITVRSTELGSVYLVNSSVSVTSVANITAAASANKNSVSITSANTNTVLTLSSLSDGVYNLYGADSFNNLSTGILATIRVDNTAPTATAIEVNSAGTAVVITGSETLTNSLQSYGIYQVTDSGSALSVNNVSFSGNIATLTLSRSIPAGATVYFTYTPGSGDARGRIVDQAGNEMAALTKRAITNNSTSAITVILNVPDPLAKGVSTTMSVAVSVEGRVTFTVAGKRVPGCFNRAATGTTPITVTCTFKPALNSRQTISATLTPTLSAYPTTTSSVERIVSRRSNRR